MNAFTSREHTAYYARLPHAELARGIEILGDVLSAPALRPHEVEAERQVIVEEILMNLDAPDDRVHTLLSQAVFGGHPLRSEEHTSELQSLMRISYAVFCLKKKN